MLQQAQSQQKKEDSYISMYTPSSSMLVDFCVSRGARKSANKNQMKVTPNSSEKPE